MKNLFILGFLLVTSVVFASVPMDIESGDREFKIISDKMADSRFKISVVDGYSAKIEHLGIFTVDDIRQIAEEISSESQNRVYLYAAGLALGTILTGGGLVYGAAIIYAAGFTTAIGTGVGTYTNYELATNGYQIVSNGIVDAHDKVVVTSNYVAEKIIAKLKNFKN